jgi:hypothetical protein
MAIRNDGAEPALQGSSLRAARTQCSSSESTILQPFDQFERDCCSAGFGPRLCQNRVKTGGVARSSVVSEFRHPPKPDAMLGLLSGTFPESTLRV